jgi:hypothetical protein
VYIHLSDLALTNTTHAAAFGSGETIVAGVYSIGGAGSLAGTLTLNGQGNTDATFVIKFEGGFSAAAGSRIVLANGTRACNVFWIAEGAISIGASSITKGTLIAHPGAVTVAAGSNLEGRMFTTEGAITFGPGVATLPTGPISIPISCVNSCSNNILGTAANFALFTSIGAVANAATSGIIGDIGANAGDISGFETSTVAGSFNNVNSVTAQASIDLLAGYNQLVAIPTTNTSHTPAFGSGETVSAGVYSIAAAGSLAGTITLDAQGNPDALFIFKFAGAFTTAAQSKVVFKNGVRRCNVFWIAEGAISMGTFTFMKGTLIAHNGANTMGANGNLEGRMLSTTGAIGFSTGVIYNNTMCFADPIAVIAAVNDTLSVNGSIGGTLTNVLSNDKLNGLAVLPSQVTTTFVSSTNTGITLSGTNVIVATGTPAGTYSLIYRICQIANPTNCSQAIVTITVLCAPIATPCVTLTQPTCYSTGTITVTSPLGSRLTYSINGTTYQTSPIFANLTANSYNVTVKNGACISTALITKLNPGSIPAPTTTVKQTTCASPTGTITVGSLGEGYSYSIGGAYQTSPIFSGVTANIYYVTAMYGSCISIVKVTVVNIQPATPLTPTVMVTQMTTTIATATIKVTSPLGTGLTYSINGTTYQSSPIFSGLTSACNYNVTVKNAYCTSPIKVVTINRRPTSSKQAVENEFTNDLTVIVAPNPSSEVFELAIQSLSDETISIRIIDLNGRIINTLKSNPQETNTVRFGNELSSGLYFIEITQGNKRKVVKAQKI